MFMYIHNMHAQYACAICIPNLQTPWVARTSRGGPQLVQGRYIYIYIYIYTQTHTHTSLSLYKYIYTYVYIYIYIYSFTVKYR